LILQRRNLFKRSHWPDVKPKIAFEQSCAS
jgi:hypothetical protein